ncbi:MAG: MFS transporter, partial [Actinobacteria bacterium]|nr:MFS transporter [Actinomycetota bacterium]
LALLATLATERSDGLRAAGEPVASALNAGYHLAYLVGAALVLAALAVAVGALRPKRSAHEAPRTLAEPAYSRAA